MKKYQKKNKPTKYLLFLLFLLFSLTLQVNAQNNIKRFPIKSAKITYKIKSPQGEGTKVLFFDQYGKRESSHETLNKRGKTVKDQLTILNNGKAYSINLLTNKGQDISAQTGMAMKMMTGATGKDMSATGKKMLESMGGKQVGTQNFLGKNCEKWEVRTMGKTTMLIWQGIPLKTESSVMGMKSSEEATSVHAGLSFSNNDFEPPAGVEIERLDMGGMGAGMQMSTDDKAQMKKLMSMSYADFKKQMKKGNPNITDEEIQQAYNMMKQMGKILK